jgi:hypothetical protein
MVEFTMEMGPDGPAGRERSVGQPFDMKVVVFSGPVGFAVKVERRYGREVVQTPFSVEKSK